MRQGGVGWNDREKWCNSTFNNIRAQDDVKSELDLNPAVVHIRSHRVRRYMNMDTNFLFGNQELSRFSSSLCPFMTELSIIAHFN